MSKETQPSSEENAELSKIAPGKTMIISPKDTYLARTGKTVQQDQRTDSK